MKRYTILWLALLTLAALGLSQPLSAQSIGADSESPRATHWSYTRTEFTQFAGIGVGYVDIIGYSNCEDCVCQYVGTPTFTEFATGHRCEFLGCTKVTITCGGTEACPDGGTGELMTCRFECCVRFLWIVPLQCDTYFVRHYICQ